MNTDVESYLLEQLERRKRMGLPEYGEAGARQAKYISDANNTNNLMAVLADSAAKAGSLGGKVADASSVRRFADASTDQNQRFLTGLRQDEEGAEKSRGKEEALAEYLMNKKADREKLASQEKLQGQKQLYDEAKQERRFAQEDSLKKQDLALRREELAMKGKTENLKQAKEKEPSQPQFKDAGYGKRIEQANAVLEQLNEEGYDRTSTMEGLKSYLPRQLQSASLQKQEQAERNFVNAVLRQESGAAISTSEFANAEKQYFPRAGDTPEVLAQKKQNRDQQLEMFRAAAGRAWDKVPSVALEKPKVKGESGTAYADQPSKAPEEMSEEELDKEIARLKGKK